MSAGGRKEECLGLEEEWGGKIVRRNNGGMKEEKEYGRKEGREEMEEVKDNA